MSCGESSHPRRSAIFLWAALSALHVAASRFQRPARARSAAGWNCETAAARGPGLKSRLGCITLEYCMARAEKFAAAALALACCACLACDSSRSVERSGPPAPPAAARTAADPADTRPRVVALGDSLTAGLGLQPSQAYPALLQQRIDSEGLRFLVVNAGVSGDTSAGGLSRLDWALDGDVRVLIVALGGNDGLRGLDPSELRKNLATIIERAQAKHIAVVLAGMEAPPNFGQGYIVSFHQVYPALAATYHVALVPFLLQGVAGVDTLNQQDGIHPTVEGARIVADNVWKVLGPLLEKGLPSK